MINVYKNLVRSAKDFLIMYENTFMYNLQIKFQNTQSCRPFYSSHICRKVVPFNLSNIGEGIRQVLITEWFVKEGDKINEFDRICQVQTSKSVLNVMSKYQGTIKKLHYKINSIAYVDQPLIDIDTGSDKLVGQTPELSETRIIPYNLSDITECMTEVMLTEWFVEEGDIIKQYDNICEILSDKSTVIINSKYDGIVKKLYYKVYEMATVGKPLIDIEVQENEYKQIPGIIPISDVYSYKERMNSPMHQSIQRFDKDIDLNLATIIGGGKVGQNLNNNFLNMNTERPVEMSHRFLLPVLSSESSCKNDQIIRPITEVTKRMIETMKESVKIPHLVYYDEIRVTSLMRLTRKLKKHKLKMTFLPFFLKAASNSIFKHPNINARLDLTEANIIFYKTHNISIAIDTPNGLVVPVIKDVRRKNIIQINKEISQLVKQAKTGKLKNEVSEATITVTNIGAGGTYLKPVILPTQNVIISIGAFKDMPLYSRRGQLKKETVCFVSIAADHRIIDVKTIKKFCKNIKKQIEDPDLLILNI